MLSLGSKEGRKRSFFVSSGHTDSSQLALCIENCNHGATRKTVTKKLLPIFPKDLESVDSSKYKKNNHQQNKCHVHCWWLLNSLECHTVTIPYLPVTNETLMMSFFSLRATVLWNKWLPDDLLFSQWKLNFKSLCSWRRTLKLDLRELLKIYKNTLRTLFLFFIKKKSKK